MRIFDRRPALRWLAPLALVLVVGGAGGVVAVSASADPPLPAKTAEQLLVDLQGAKVDGLSGTVVQTADLGLPSIPGAGGDSSDLTSLISGTHTLRVWYAGPDKARVALLGTLGESDVVRNGTDVWTWSSKDNTAKHVDLSGAPKAEQKERTPAETMTPEAAAAKVLAAVGPTTDVSTSGTATVAGRSAYELVLRPKDSGSLVSAVRIAVDSETSVPLRVQVVGAADKTAFEVGFTAVDFATPDAAQFAFNPPPGAKVTEVKPPAHDGSKADKKTDLSPAEKKAAEKEAAESTKVVGEGWTSVVVSKLDLTGSAAGDKKSEGQGGQAGQMLNALPKVSGDWGSGRLLAGTVFSAVITDDGRIAVGSVAPEVLYRALAK